MITKAAIKSPHATSATCVTESGQSNQDLATRRLSYGHGQLATVAAGFPPRSFWHGRHRAVGRSKRQPWRIPAAAAAVSPAPRPR